MPRKRLHSNDPLFKFRNMLEAQGLPAQAGRSRLGRVAARPVTESAIVSQGTGGVASIDGRSGTATIASPNTSVTVAHTFPTTPEIQDFTVTPTNNLGSATKFWIDSVSAANLVIAVDADPVTQATFVWKLVQTATAAAPEGELPVTAGLIAHFDATQLTGLADLDPVGTWPDLSATGADLMQATAGNQPTYRTGVINGQPAVLFDGSNDYLATSTPQQFVSASSGEWTAFAVCTKSALSGTRGVVTGDNVGGSTNRVAQFLRWTGGTPQSLAWGGPATDNGPTAAAAGSFIDEAVRTTSTLDRLLNGVSDGATAAATPTTATCGLALGAGTGQSGIQAFHNGYIGEVVMYNTALSSTDRDLVRQYLADKWGVTI